MSDFEREERYVVVKLKDLTPAQRTALQCHLDVHATPTREAVVAEPHHPHHMETWENVQRWAEGWPTVGEERDALAAHVERLEHWIRNCNQHASILDDTPAASLARRAAEQQAEVLEAARIEHTGDRCYCAARMKKAAAGLRRQAEDGS